MIKGLVHVYTGDGKGKTTAALGLALRVAGQGQRVTVVQFLKGAADCGEHFFASKYKPFEIVQFTKGNCFTLPTEQLESDVDKTMEFVEKIVENGKYRVIVLDEIFVAIRRGLLETDRVIKLIHNKPDSLELVLTGRSAPEKVMELADYVTEMKMKKHPYTQGMAARKGIEY